MIDFRRDKDQFRPGSRRSQYDPNRSARIALLNYVDGEKRYILAPDWDLAVGAPMLESGPEAPPTVGNCLPLSRVPLGTDIHNIELLPGQGGCLCRSAGTSGTLVAREKRIGLRLRCPAARFGESRPGAGPPWARWATRITWRFGWARRGGNVGWGGGRTCGAR